MCTCRTQVCITLYWLGQAVTELDNYNGPQLDLGAFKHLMEDIVSHRYCAHNLHSSPTPPTHRTLTSQMVVVFQKRKKMNLQQPIMSRRRPNLLGSRRRASPVVSKRFTSRRRTWRMDLGSHLSRSRQQTSCWQTSRMQWMRCCRSSR